MKNKFTYLIKAVCFYWIFQLVSNNVIAQCDTCSSEVIPFPKMWVDSSMTKYYIERLLWSEIDRPSKYEKLSKLVAFKKSFFIPVLSFDKLISQINESNENQTLRIYFSIYNKDAGAPNFSLKNGQLLLLFALGTYKVNYNPIYFFDSNGDFQKIDSSIANRWMENYEKNVLPQLKSTIREQDQSNYDEVRKKTSDTRYISFGIDSIKQAFELEKNYQYNKHNIRISGYVVSLSSFEKSNRKYPLRLFVQFDYMKKSAAGKDEIFYIDSQDDYTCRFCKWQIAKDENGQSRGLDNGHLCPANCPVKQ